MRNYLNDMTSATPSTILRRVCAPPPPATARATAAAIHPPPEPDRLVEQLQRDLADVAPRSSFPESHQAGAPILFNWWNRSTAKPAFEQRAPQALLRGSAACGRACGRSRRKGRAPAAPAPAARRPAVERRVQGAIEPPPDRPDTRARSGTAPCRRSLSNPSQSPRRLSGSSCRTTTFGVRRKRLRSACR